MKNKITLLRAIVSALVARANCERSGNSEWYGKHSARLESLAEFLPSGSGFDSGTEIDVERTSEKGADTIRERIFLNTSFHHIDSESGCYDGWTSHRITVRPDLLFGFDLTISGPDRNGIKEYMHEVFAAALSAEVEENEKGEFSLCR